MLRDFNMYVWEKKHKKLLDFIAGAFCVFSVGWIVLGTIAVIAQAFGIIAL